MEVFRKTDRIGNLVLKILQFLVADALSVGDVDQNNLQRLIQVVGFDEVIFVVILVINQKQAVFVLIVPVVDLFYQFNGLRALEAGIVVEKYVNYRLVIIRIGFVEIFLQILVRVVSSFVCQFGMQGNGQRNHNHKSPQKFYHLFSPHRVETHSGEQASFNQFFSLAFRNGESRS